MLGKLIKQEFRATGRVMLPVMGVLLLLSLLANISIRLLDRVDNRFLTVLLILVVVVFGLGVFAAALVTLAMMVSRFRRNLLGDEGYLMHTLPVNVHGLIGSKLLVSLVWFIVTGLVVTLVVFLTALIQSGTNLSEVFSQLPSWSELKEMLAAYGIPMGQLTQTLLLILALMLVTIVTSCLHFYAALSLGHMFNRDKVLLSIVFFVLLSIAMSLLTNLIGSRIFDTVYIDSVDTFFAGITALRRMLLGFLGLELLEGALFYIASALGLRRGLNLA